MTTDDKLDKLMEDVAVIKTTMSVHNTELSDINKKLEPVIFHINGVRWAVKVGASIVGLLACVATVLALFKS